MKTLVAEGLSLNDADTLTDRDKLLTGDICGVFDLPVGPANLKIGVLFFSEAEVQPPVIRGMETAWTGHRPGVPSFCVSDHSCGPDRTEIRHYIDQFDVEPIGTPSSQILKTNAGSFQWVVRKDFFHFRIGAARQQENIDETIVTPRPPALAVRDRAIQLFEFRVADSRGKGLCEPVR